MFLEHTYLQRLSSKDLTKFRMRLDSAERALEEEVGFRTQNPVLGPRFVLGSLSAYCQTVMDIVWQATRALRLPRVETESVLFAAGETLSRYIRSAKLNPHFNRVRPSLGVVADAVWLWPSLSPLEHICALFEKEISDVVQSFIEGGATLVPQYEDRQGSRRGPRPDEERNARILRILERWEDNSPNSIKKICLALDAQGVSTPARWEGVSWSEMLAKTPRRVQDCLRIFRKRHVVKKTCRN